MTPMSYLDPALTPVFDQWEAMIKNECVHTEPHVVRLAGGRALLAQKKAG